MKVRAMSAFLPPGAPRRRFLSEDALALVFGLLVTGLGFALAVQPAAGANIVWLIALVLALFSGGVLSDFRRLRDDGLSFLAAAYVAGVAGFLVWLAMARGGAALAGMGK
jgi:FtsH-binding integral membrane protein